MARSLAELVNVDEPAWPLVRQWIAEAARPVEELPPSQPAREAALLAVQVTTRSPLGAVIWETGGLLIDDGWLRILGSGHPRLARRIDEWNAKHAVDPDGRPGGYFLVADDVIGGFFALTGGSLGPGQGDVYYYAPDSLRWESLEVGYSAFLQFCLIGDVGDFYSPHRWPGWREEVARVAGDQALSIYPFLWTHEGKDIQRTSRRAVHVAEIWGMNRDMARQLDSDAAP